jgi:hypothetical protein
MQTKRCMNDNTLPNNPTKFLIFSQLKECHQHSNISVILHFKYIVQLSLQSATNAQLLCASHVKSLSLLL